MRVAFQGRLSLIALSKFLDFSEFLENSWKDHKANKRDSERLGAFPLNLDLLLEPERDPPANRTTPGTQLRQNFSIVRARLNVKQVTRVEYGLSPDR